jgi:hypothetical protein
VIHAKTERDFCLPHSPEATLTGATSPPPPVTAGAAAILTDDRPQETALKAIADSGVPVLTCASPRHELAMAGRALSGHASPA